MKYYGIAIGGENAGKYFEFDDQFFRILKNSKSSSLVSIPEGTVKHSSIENDIEEYKHFTLRYLGNPKIQFHFWVPTTVSGDLGEYVLRELVTGYRAHYEGKEKCSG